FLFQIKSSLDILVKLLRVVAPPGIISTQTYAKEGDAIVKGLSQLKKKAGIVESRVDRLIALVESEKMAWLKTVVEWRDELSHYTTVKNHRFVPREIAKHRYEP